MLPNTSLLHIFYLIHLICSVEVIVNAETVPLMLSHTKSSFNF